MKRSYQHVHGGCGDVPPHGYTTKPSIKNTESQSPRKKIISTGQYAQLQCAILGGAHYACVSAQICIEYKMKAACAAVVSDLSLIDRLLSIVYNEALGRPSKCKSIGDVLMKTFNHFPF